MVLCVFAYQLLSVKYKLSQLELVKEQKHAMAQKVLGGHANVADELGILSKEETQQALLATGSSGLQHEVKHHHAVSMLLLQKA